MDSEDYERRKAALEEIYRADIALVRAAHEARLRSLEALRHSVEPDAPLPGPPEDAPGVPHPAGQNQKPDLRPALQKVFPLLPAVFEKKDVIAALGWTPSHGALNRALTELVVTGKVIYEETSVGRHPARYRKA